MFKTKGKSLRKLIDTSQNSWYNMVTRLRNLVTERGKTKEESNPQAVKPLPNLRKEVSIMTKKECFVALLTIADVQNNPELKSFVEKEIDTLSKPRKMSAAQLEKAQENEAIREKIAAVLSDGVERTLKEIAKVDEELSVYSSQKLSPIASSLVKMGRAVKEVKKGKTYFKAC